MAQSIAFLSLVAAAAVIGLLYSVVYGFREDTCTAVGGLVGIALAIWRIKPSHHTMQNSEGPLFESWPFFSLFIDFIFLVFWVFVFSFIGWLTGYIHWHGELAGAVGGAFGGFVLSTCVPAYLGSDLMSFRRDLQLRVALIAFVGILVVVAIMYEHLLR